MREPRGDRPLASLNGLPTDPRVLRAHRLARSKSTDADPPAADPGPPRGAAAAACAPHPSQNSDP
jgi:hypothetical protein